MADAQSTANRAIEMRRARGRAYYYRHREKILEIERAKREPARIAARNRAIEQGRRPHGEGRDLDKRKATRCAWYARNPDARRKAAENSAAYRHKSPEARERWRQWKRNARAKKGATALSLIRERQQDGLAAQNARQAWRWWLKNAPDWWMRGYYRSLGKPWGNPRLSGAVKWRIRYWLDPSFRAREIEKVQTLKEKRAARIKANNDGTLTGNVIVKLFAQARVCPYCTRPMRSVEKSLDHIVPLSRGGAHSVYNALVCCKTCNSRKAAGPSPLLGSSPLPGSGVIGTPAIWDM